jgi:hypothetical protein
LNIKYDILISDQTRNTYRSFLTIGSKKSGVSHSKTDNAQPGVGNISITEMPMEMYHLRERLNQEILDQGVDGLKLGLSGRVKIGKTRFGFAWKM